MVRAITRCDVSCFLAGGGRRLGVENFGEEPVCEQTEATRETH